MIVISTVTLCSPLCSHCKARVFSAFPVAGREPDGVCCSANLRKERKRTFTGPWPLRCVFARREASFRPKLFPLACLAAQGAAGLEEARPGCRCGGSRGVRVPSPAPTAQGWAGEPSSHPWETRPQHLCTAHAAPATPSSPSTLAPRGGEGPSKSRGLAKRPELAKKTKRSDNKINARPTQSPRGARWGQQSVHRGQTAPAGDGRRRRHGDAALPRWDPACSEASAGRERNLPRHFNSSSAI